MQQSTTGRRTVKVITRTHTDQLGSRPSSCKFYGITRDCDPDHVTVMLLGVSVTSTGEWILQELWGIGVRGNDPLTASLPEESPANEYDTV